jgi:tyrosyl-tRNA synthetase
MLTAECFKQRMEQGLSFLEFNYMLMQSYDFLELFRKYDCRMQFGGDDQWSNILGGVDLIRREAGGRAYGMTFTLLQTSDGKKMGKTQKGALWLDAGKTSPYEFFQYWRNVEDADVRSCLSMLTFLPMDEVETLSALRDEGLNRAKEILAYEVTRLVHGATEAEKARDAARALFAGGADSDDIPTTLLPAERFLGAGVGLAELIRELGLVKSNGEGLRAIEQGGLSIDDERITDKKFTVTKELFKEDVILIKKGKKTFRRIKLC